MTKSWGAATFGEFECPHCRALYVANFTHVPQKHEGTASCDVCGRVMSHWNATTVPSYRLIKRPEERNPPI
jgi:transcription elongation factor Elf1